MAEHTIGVDISKSHLDVFRLEDGAAQRFDNSAAGCRALIKWLGKAPVARIVFEPTGPYHRGFETVLSGRFPLVKVTPLQARRCAEASRMRAKTDAIDAHVLARMGAALALEPDRSVSENSCELRDLQVARTGLVKERTRLRNRGQAQGNRVLKRQTRTRLALVERRIEDPDAEIAKRTAGNEAMARKREILRSIPGLGQMAAAAILTFLPDLGTMGRKQLGRLASPAPHPRETGQWKGKAVISGGRKPLRDALSMPALVAMRFNPDLKVKYTALRAAGKPTKVAIVAFVGKTAPSAVF
ncbi:IS110 family transposase [Rhodosalinus sediminis]|uniref:IS110 family transposase n=1 Tax=Rhodosalinus sediminis TaxID=1940533 RepID=UPI001EFEC12E|nr:IS110 family transposase [Rhodosalinus sediminis]